MAREKGERDEGRALVSRAARLGRGEGEGRGRARARGWGAGGWVRGGALGARLVRLLVRGLRLRDQLARILPAVPLLALELRREALDRRVHPVALPHQLLPHLLCTRRDHARVGPEARAHARAGSQPAHGPCARARASSCRTLWSSSRASALGSFRGRPARACKGGWEG